MCMTSPISSGCSAAGPCAQTLCLLSASAGPPKGPQRSQLMSAAPCFLDVSSRQDLLGPLRTQGDPHLEFSRACTPQPSWGTAFSSPSPPEASGPDTFFFYLQTRAISHATEQLSCENLIRLLSCQLLHVCSIELGFWKVS